MAGHMLDMFPGSQALAVRYCEGRCRPRDRRREISVTVDDLIRRYNPLLFVSSKDAVELDGKGYGCKSGCGISEQLAE